MENNVEVIIKIRPLEEDSPKINGLNISKNNEILIDNKSYLFKHIYSTKIECDNIFNKQVKPMILNFLNFT